MTMSSSSNQGATPIHLTVMMNRACQFFSAPHHPQIDLMSSTQSPPALPLLPAKNKIRILSSQSSHRFHRAVYLCQPSSPSMLPQIAPAIS